MDSARDYSNPSERYPLLFFTNFDVRVCLSGFVPYWHSIPFPSSCVPCSSQESNKSRPSGTFIIREDTKAARNGREASSSSSVKTSRGVANGLVLETSSRIPLPRQRLSGTRGKGGIFRPWTMDQSLKAEPAVLTRPITEFSRVRRLIDDRDEWILVLHIYIGIKSYLKMFQNTIIYFSWKKRIV